MLRVNTILLFLFFGVLLSAQQQRLSIDSLRFAKERPKIGLALSGGAAHGLAHIGVLQYLEELEIEIDYVTGTSMGAIIGALHAMGYNGYEIEDIAKKLDWNGILNNEVYLNEVAAVEKRYHDKYPLIFVIEDNEILLPQGFLNTNRLEMELARLFAPAMAIDDFNDLPIPFKCFGVDIETGEVITLEKGRLVKALRASMAIPSVFAPKYYQGRHLVDGGLMRNFPVSDNREMGANFVIGSYVGREKADISELRTLVDILTESAFMMSIVDSENQKRDADILLLPDVKDMGVFDFEDYEFFIKQGYLSAQENADSLKKLSQILSQFPKAEEKTLQDPGFVFIDSIRVGNLPKSDRDLVIDKLAIQERSYVNFDRIEEGVNRVFSTLNFESVSYDVIRDGPHNLLVIEAVPREEKRLGINLNHFATTNSSLIVNGQIRNFVFRLSNLRFSLRLSENVAIGGEYFLRGGLNNKNWVFGMRMEAQRSDMVFESFGRQRKNGFLWEGHIIPYVTYEFSNYSSIRGEIDFKRHDFHNEIQSLLDLDRFIESGIRLGAEYVFDNRDARVMTKKGFFFVANAGFGFNIGNNIRYTDLEADGIVQFPRGRQFFESEILISETIPISDVVWWTLSGNAYYKSAPSLLDNYAIGGTTLEGIRNLPFIGYSEQELRTDKHLYIRSDLRLGVFENVSVSLIGNLLVGDSEVYNYSDPLRDNTLTAYGMGIELGIMLPIGPVLLDIGYNSEEDDINAEVSIGWKHFF